MLDFVRGPLYDKSGATVVEYGLLIGVIAMTVFLSMNVFVNALFTMHDAISGNIDKSKQ